MLTAFKALTGKAKLGLVALVLAILVAIVGSTAYFSYQRGLGVSALEIQKYQTESKKLQKKLAQAQTKVDVRVVTEYKDRIAYVDRVVYKTRDVIRDNVPEQFTLSRGWIYAYNQSVLGLEPDPEKAANKEPSTVSEMRALADTIAPNNGICIANKVRLDSLQQWVRETNETRNNINPR